MIGAPQRLERDRIAKLHGIARWFTATTADFIDDRARAPR
jgi:hypothetical protein